ncbi:MAG: hypothetical protein M1833_004492 [Piccolia ochrophora]|nr:MAG: hypothetical protein M1833_004492 [Piccolia ochrophora]
MSPKSEPRSPPASAQRSLRARTRSTSPSSYPRARVGCRPRLDRMDEPDGISDLLETALNAVETDVHQLMLKWGKATSNKGAGPVERSQLILDKLKGVKALVHGYGDRMKDWEWRIGAFSKVDAEMKVFMDGRHSEDAICHKIWNIVENRNIGGVTKSYVRSFEFSVDDLTASHIRLASLSGLLHSIAHPVAAGRAQPEVFDQEPLDAELLMTADPAPVSPDTPMWKVKLKRYGLDNLECGEEEQRLCKKAAGMVMLLMDDVEAIAAGCTKAKAKADRLTYTWDAWVDRIHENEDHSRRRQENDRSERD